MKKDNWSFSEHYYTCGSFHHGDKSYDYSLSASAHTGKDPEGKIRISTIEGEQGEFPDQDYRYNVYVINESYPLETAIEGKMFLMGKLYDFQKKIGYDPNYLPF